MLDDTKSFQLPSDINNLLHIKINCLSLAIYLMVSCADNKRIAKVQLSACVKVAFFQSQIFKVVFNSNYVGESIEGQGRFKFNRFNKLKPPKRLNFSIPSRTQGKYSTSIPKNHKIFRRAFPFNPNERNWDPQNPHLLSHKHDLKKMNIFSIKGQTISERNAS